jgi:hypothetical protein
LVSNLGNYVMVLRSEYRQRNGSIRKQKLVNRLWGKRLVYDGLDCIFALLGPSQTCCTVRVQKFCHINKCKHYLEL